MLRQFNHLGRRFKEFDDLAPAILAERVKGPPPSVSAADQELIVSYLTSPAAAGLLPPSFVLQPDDLARAVQAAGGATTTVWHLRRYHEIGRSFTHFGQVVPAITEADMRGTHASEDDRNRIGEYLSEQSLIFGEAPEFKVQSADCDDLLRAGGGAEKTLHHLHRFDAVGRRFEDFADLAPAIEMAARTGGHVSVEDKKAVIEYLVLSLIHI